MKTIFKILLNEVFCPDGTFRTNIAFIPLLYHAFRDHFYYFSTNQKRDLYYLSEMLHIPLHLLLFYTCAAMIQTTIEILQAL